MEFVNDRGTPRTYKARLLEVILAAPADEVAAMLDRFWSAKWFEMRQAPRTSLVMYTVRDPFDTLFHLGEVLVSTAEVMLGRHIGLGMICGDAPECALLLACVEAAEASSRTALPDDLPDFVERLEKKCVEERGLLSKLTAATAVRFDTMRKESVNFGSLGD